MLMGVEVRGGRDALRMTAVQSPTAAPLFVGDCPLAVKPTIAFALLERGQSVCVTPLSRSLRGGPGPWRMPLWRMWLRCPLIRLRLSLLPTRVGA